MLSPTTAAPANQVAGNLIGVGGDGTTPLGNQFNGVRIGSDNNTIGPNNLIANNHHSGIMLTGRNTVILSNTLESNGRSGICVTGANTTINGNAVLRNGAGGGPWPDCNIRGGIVITGTDNTLVNDNQVLFNTDAGVTVYQGQSNRILVNSISENGTAGIQLEQGGNNGVAPPAIETVTGTTISGRACPLCRVDIFTDGNDEGMYYAGTTTAQSDGRFTITIAPADIHGPHFTATDTDSAGNTSPFGVAVPVPPPDNQKPVPSPTPRPTPGPTLYPYHVFLPLGRS
jgi:Right handed beta helix region/Bacterial Ig domain